MKKWTVAIVLGCAQFVMVLDSTVMNVSISTVVKDLDTTVAALQTCITFYTLTMAAFMLLGAKLGDVWGRKKAFTIGAIIYALGSLITGLSPNVATLFFGWSIIEGLGAVLVIPAIAALLADNYKGKDRVRAFALIGALSGAAMAAGPLIGGFATTYLSWRYVFFGEVLTMAIVLLFRKDIFDKTRPQKIKIDMPSVLLSASGLVLLVYGMLQSKVWGWVQPMNSPEVFGYTLEPLGISMTAYLMLAGVVVLRIFFNRQRDLAAHKKRVLLDVSMFSIVHLRSGLAVLLAQYAMIAGIFFVIPVYLQMTLGYDALKTGVKIFPLSVGLILFSVVGTRLATQWSPKKIIRLGQYILIASSVVLLASVSATLRGWLFGVAMFFTGAALGLLASQIGNVNMSSVPAKRSSEVGGLQGVFQNLGSSLGTALIGSILIASLTSNFAASTQASDLPDQTKSAISQKTEQGISVVPIAEVEAYAKDTGMSEQAAEQVTSIYTNSQLESLRVALYGLIIISVLTLLFSRNIPDKVA